ncbi:MAG TPA: alcohol dehydrogenase catalytic domain-containing protein [Candidatus Acidoferrales bacterium]|nr:alcohol dehydrogenase catalytic domain-containing protein [Candidatus Acidoferrales bacterium]
MSRTGAILETQPGGGQTPRTMRAGVYRGKGQVEVEQVPVPEVADGEMLIRVAACGICGTDIKKILHGFLEPPQILGHEVAGTVVEVGRGVAKWKPGDRVMSFHHVPCGNCFYCGHKLFSQCPGYKKTGLTAGFTPNGGGFAEYVKAMPWIAEGGIVGIPPGVTFEEATFIEPANTCVKAVEKARVAAGEAVLVIGLGPIGLLLMMLSKLAGAAVYGSDPMPERRAKSMEFGADAAFDPSGGKLVDEVRGRTEGRGADAVLVAVPQPAVVTEALAAARPGGRVLLFAQNDPQMKIEFPAAAVGVEEKEILGSYSAAADIQESAAELIFSRKLPVAGLVTHRFPLSQIQQALELAARPTADSLKVLIQYS